ncbi:hypothetical protein FRX31_034281 [Thalictrum thalictroides]|uniref:Uncharacterized protein n=1 Tax=Thalictrum thalictroides TaxID=46969 RepID=A0A7J6UUK7_THATH|nr:hypothetical protein FRX31_034281 [Thalictrum thalictroides]
MDRLSASVGRSLCEPHFASFQSFSDGIAEFSTLVSEAGPIVEDELVAFFPENPLHITQEILQNFKAWVKNQEPVRNICKPWYQYIRQAHLICEVCREKAAYVVDSGSEIEDDDADEE